MVTWVYVKKILEQGLTHDFMTAKPASGNLKRPGFAPAKGEIKPGMTDGDDQR
jgi:hypothetical protein